MLRIMMIVEEDNNNNNNSNKDLPNLSLEKTVPVSPSRVCSSPLIYNRNESYPPCRPCSVSQHRKRRTRLLLRTKQLHFISSSSSSSYLSVLETMALFLLFLLSLSFSVVLSNPSPKPIMTFPSENREGGGGGIGGVGSTAAYSLFPDEDLRTGKKIRFDDDRSSGIGSLDRGRPFAATNHHRDYIRDRGGIGGDGYRAVSYPIMFEDRLHRPVTFFDNRDNNRGGGGGGRVVLDPFRPRGGSPINNRVYFDDDEITRNNRDRDRGGRYYYPADDHRFPIPPPKQQYYNDRFNHYNNNDRIRDDRPSLLNRPLSPIRPYHHHSYYPDVPVSPGPSHSKLPVGATQGNINRGNDVRIHVFDPASNSFGNPRNSAGSTKQPSSSTSNSFVENGGPSPELFLDHDQYLEYHRKIAFAREQEFRRLKALGVVTTLSSNSDDTTISLITTTTTITPPATDNPKRVLFTAKQPFDISGLSPPGRDATTPNPGATHTQEQRPIRVEKVQTNEKSNSNSDNNGGQVAVAIYTGSGSGSENSGEVTLVGVEEHIPPRNSHTPNNHHHHRDDDDSNTKRVGQVGGQNNEEGGGSFSNNNNNNNDRVDLSTKNNNNNGGGGRRNEEVEVVIESENFKSQVTEIPPEQSSRSNSRPSFISKSGRRLAYEQIQRQIHNHNQQNHHHHNSIKNGTEKEGEKAHNLGYPSHFNVRQPLVSGSNKFDDDVNVGDKVTTTTTTTTGKSADTTTTTTTGTTTAKSSSNAATALSLVEIPKEADGFVHQELSPFPDTTKPSNTGRHAHKKHASPQQSSIMKGMKKKLFSGLGTEVTKRSRSRIKANSGDKIAIIKQQELKQERKKVSKLSHLHHGHENAEVFVQPTESATSTSSSSSSPLNLHNFFENAAPNNFQIPLLPMKTRGLRVKEMKMKELKLQSNHDDFDHYNSSNNNNINTNTGLLSQHHPFLDNNDLIDPQISVELLHTSQNKENNDNYQKYNHQEDGHFTLINLNNDQVDILEDFGTPPKMTSTTTSEQVPLPNHRQADIDLYNTSNDGGDGDSLVQMGSDSFDDEMIKNNNNNSSSSSASNFIKVTRLKSPHASFSSFNPDVSVANPDYANMPTAAKTVSMFMAEQMDYYSASSKKKDASSLSFHPKTNLSPPRVLLSSSINSTTLSLLKSKQRLVKQGKKSHKFLESAKSSSSQLESTIVDLDGLKTKKANITDIEESSLPPVKMKMSMTSSTSVGVIAKVHAHVSHCPKVRSPAEIICDIHIRDSHGHPNPQLTVGWRRKFYNSTQPDILLVSNMTQVYEEMILEPSIMQSNNNNGTSSSISATTIIRGDNDEDSAKNNNDKESLEDFHDKFNVTLAPGISPMLRSVLLIRSVTAPDCGSYQCQVTDGVYTLSSETLLFLCH